MTASFDILDELYDYVNNFQSFKAYERFVHDHNLQNHRKDIQHLFHGMLIGYDIDPLPGISSFFEKIKNQHILIDIAFLLKDAKESIQTLSFNLKHF